MHRLYYTTGQRDQATSASRCDELRPHTKAVLLFIFMFRVQRLFLDGRYSFLIASS